MYFYFYFFQISIDQYRSIDRIYDKVEYVALIRSLRYVRRKNYVMRFRVCSQTSNIVN
jgi:hypothetical protein